MRCRHLAIVHQLVRAHGGEIQVTSPRIQGGATFTVILPEADIAEGILIPT
jgi:signal transduction histidine kinase